MIVTLPLSPTDSIPIDNSRFSIQISEDRITYFSNLQPFDCHPIKHQRDMLMRIGRLNVVSHVPQQHLIEDFAVSRSTVQRAARRKYREQVSNVQTMVRLHSKGGHGRKRRANLVSAASNFRIS